MQVQISSGYSRIQMVKGIKAAGKILDKLLTPCSDDYILLIKLITGHTIFLNCFIWVTNKREQRIKKYR